MDDLAIPVIPILEAERLRLRPFRRSDLDDYASPNADPEVLRYLGGAGAVGPGPVLAASGLSPGSLAARGIRHLGSGAEGNRRVPRSGRLFRARGLAGLRARLEAPASLLGARLRHRGRTDRPGLRLHRPRQGPDHQPHPAGEPGVGPSGRAPWREPTRSHPADEQGISRLRHRPGELSAEDCRARPLLRREQRRLVGLLGKDLKRVRSTERQPRLDGMALRQAASVDGKPSYNAGMNAFTQAVGCPSIGGAGSAHRARTSSCPCVPRRQAGEECVPRISYELSVS